MEVRHFKCIDCGVDVEVQADCWIEGVAGDIVTSTGQKIHYDDPTNTERCCLACLQVRLEKFIKELKPIEN